MRYRQYTSSLIKDLYVANHFVNHAASLHQTFVHCGRFSTAATRRCMGRVSVPSVGVRLSPPLDVIALVSFYLTNQLISYRPFPERVLNKEQLYSGETIVYQHTFRCVIHDSGVRTYILLPRLPLTSVLLQNIALFCIATPLYFIDQKNKVRSTCMPYPRRQRSS